MSLFSLGSKPFFEASSRLPLTMCRSTVLYPRAPGCSGVKHLTSCQQRRGCWECIREAVISASSPISQKLDHKSNWKGSDGRYFVHMCVWWCTSSCPNFQGPWIMIGEREVEPLVVWRTARAETYSERADKGRPRWRLRVRLMANWSIRVASRADSTGWDSGPEQSDTWSVPAFAEHQGNL